MKKVGLLTGGGDCPGLNAVIRGVVSRLAKDDIGSIGFLEGWRGVIEGNTAELNETIVRDILHLGGTNLGSSRTNPYKNEAEDIPKIKQNFKKFEIDALVAIGGDDTLTAANRLWESEKLPVVGVPKTIDNDLSCTDFTFGFDTAVNNAMRAIDSLHDTAFSHRRVIVIECMGRHAGWITAYAGMAASADIILVPEKPIDIDEVCALLKRNRDKGKLYNIVAVSEGAKLEETEVTKDKTKDAFGNIKLGGIAERLAKIIEKKTGYETRHVVLGHLQRGGSPSAFDRILGTRYGVKAAELVLKKNFGKMVALQGHHIVAVDIVDAVGKSKTLDMEFYRIASVFFG